VSRPDGAEATGANGPDGTDGPALPVGAVCVTGMHRSGTSAVARALMLAGVGFGDEAVLMGPGPDNAAGYWEHRLVKELDDLVLAALGGSWDRPPVLAPGWELDPRLDELRRRARHLLASTFLPLPDDVVLVGWKDPRLSLLVPFWRTVTDVVATVTVVRDPREVAASLARRNGTTPADAALLWLRHVVGAAGDDPGQLVVAHGDLLADPEGTLRRMSAHLGLPEPSAATERAVRGHLDPSLLHHRVDPDGARPADPVSALALAVYDEGRLDLGILGPEVRAGLAQGWLRAPGDDAALAAARAEVTDLTERLRVRSRAAKAAVRAAEAAEAALAGVPGASEEARAAADAARTAARAAIEVGGPAATGGDRG
jgi:hypothetical protein